MTWAALPREVRVASSTIRRFESAADAEADGVLPLISWVGVSPEKFIAGTAVPEAMLPPLDGGLIRVDMGLVDEGSGDLRRSRVGARTSIQRLVGGPEFLPIGRFADTVERLVADTDGSHAAGSARQLA